VNLKLYDKDNNDKLLTCRKACFDCSGRRIWSQKGWQQAIELSTVVPFWYGCGSLWLHSRVLYIHSKWGPHEPFSGVDSDYEDE
jgi:hypothetical protein